MSVAGVCLLCVCVCSRCVFVVGLGVCVAGVSLLGNALDYRGGDRGWLLPA